MFKYCLIIPVQLVILEIWVGKRDKINALAKETWLWCRDRAIWLTATHIPGILNEADFCSRNFINEIE